MNTSLLVTYKLAILNCYFNLLTLLVNICTTCSSNYQVTGIVLDSYLPSTAQGPFTNNSKLFLLSLSIIMLYSMGHIIDIVNQTPYW